MADKHVYTFPNGSKLVYYQQNYNKCTDVNIGFRIPLLDIPAPDEIVGTYKNVVFYMDKDNYIRVPLIKPGIAHFVEHMFFSSLPDMPVNEIYKKLQRTNTISNASTFQDFVKTEFNCPSKFVDDIFELESKMIFRDGYNQDELENEKGAIFQELEMIIDSKVPSLLDTLTNNMSTLTDEEILGLDKLVINSFTEKQLIRFAKTYFTQENLLMTVTSNLPFEKIKELCEEHFVNKAPSIKETKITTPPRQYEFQSDIFLVSPEIGSKTATIEFILKGSTNFEQNAIYTNVEDFLLNSFNGRLFNAFRNNNSLVYTPSFENLNLPQQPLKVFNIQTTPKNVKKCTLKLAEILDDLLTNGITDEEFAGFKEMWENRRERKSAVKYNSAENLFLKVIYDEPIFVSEFYEKTQKLTKDQINKYIWDVYSKSNLCMSISGNYRKKDIVPIQTVLAKYRPYDKYLNDNYIDHDEEKQLNSYLVYSAQHPDEELMIHFVGEEEETKKARKNKKQVDEETNQDVKDKKGTKKIVIQKDEIIKNTVDEMELK